MISVPKNIVLLELAGEVLIELADRKFSSIFQEKSRWLYCLNEYSKKYGVKIGEAAEAVNAKLRRDTNRGPEQDSTALIKQDRVEELWEDFAMMHWNYLNWYNNTDQSCKVAYSKIKKMQEGIVDNVAWDEEHLSQEEITEWRVK
jgi:hypothetical protein